MKTREEVEDLKQNWASDPCWDIYDTEGFEEYEKELREFQAEHERISEIQWQKRKKELIKNSTVHPLDNEIKYTNYDGLTKRELFAAMAMQGFLINPDYNNATHEQTAEMSIKAADALLEKLNN